MIRLRLSGPLWFWDLPQSSDISPKLVLLSLAIAITTGSVMSPIGNPQNLLVAVNSGLQTPFVTFGLYSFPPTIISLGVAFLSCVFLLRESSQTGQSSRGGTGLCTRAKVLPVKCSLAILLFLAVINIAASLSGGILLIPLPVYCSMRCVPSCSFSSRRVEWYGTLTGNARFLRRDVCSDGECLADRNSSGCLFPVQDSCQFLRFLAQA